MELEAGDTVETTTELLMIAVLVKDIDRGTEVMLVVTQVEEFVTVIIMDVKLEDGDNKLEDDNVVDDIGNIIELLVAVEVFVMLVDDRVGVGITSMLLVIELDITGGTILKSKNMVVSEKGSLAN